MGDYAFMLPFVGAVAFVVALYAFIYTTEGIQALIRHRQHCRKLRDDFVPQSVCMSCGEITYDRHKCKLSKGMAQ